MKSNYRARKRLGFATAIAALTIFGSLPATASAGPLEDLAGGLNNLLGGGSSADQGGSPGNAPKAHAEGTVAAVDVDSPEPLRQSAVGDLLDDEEVVVGRSRAEQQADGKHNGRVTILGLLGEEIIGIDTQEGETANSPFQPIQDVLDRFCAGSNNAFCLEVLDADSASDSSGSSNDFGVARADLRLSEDRSITAGVAESSADLRTDGNCQNATATSGLARAGLLGILDVSVLQSAVASASCGGSAPTQTNDSTIASINGNDVPLPAGCDGDSVNAGFGILGLVGVSCNPDSSSGSGVGIGGSRGTVGVTAAGEPLAAAPLAAVDAPNASSSAGASQAPTTGGPGDDGSGGPGDTGTGGPGDDGQGQSTTDDGAGDDAGAVAGEAQGAESGSLPVTGAQLGALLIVGLGLVLTGLAVASRRRPRRIGVSL
jgi:LPXTG-motif cell wall-anchored protein